MKNSKFSNITISIATSIIGVIIALLLGEAIVRFKNSTMKNYDIEMWRYSKYLKKKSDINILGHEHVPSKCEILQLVEICTDSKGLRVDKNNSDIYSGVNNRRILFLGGSVTLGWGVVENETTTSLLQKKFPPSQGVEVLNAGIGNYNAARYVTRFNERSF